MTTHYEIVDADDQLVGNMKHATAEKAQELMFALLDAGSNTPMHVARVRERTVVERTVMRLSPQRRD